MAAVDKRRARLTELANSIKANNAKIQKIFEDADKKGQTEDTPADIESIKALNLENEPLIKQFNDLKSVLEIKDGMFDPATGHSDGGEDRADGGTQRQSYGMLKSLGDRVLEDQDLSKYIKGLSPSLLSGTRIDSPKVEVGSFFKTLITGASGDQLPSPNGPGAGALVFPDYKPIVDQFYQRPLKVRDLITSGNTTGDTVEYVRITAVTNAAATVAEAANITDGDSSGKKPESAMTFARVLENVRTLAHWIPATNRALMDAGQLRTLVDEFLRYGVEELVENQILHGSGTGEDFHGIFVTANINDQEFDTDVLRTTRRARTLVQVQGHTAPTAYVMHPNDWEAIDLTKDSQGRYYFGGPTVMGQKTLWGLPVVESELIEQGVSILGNWKMAVLWDRMQSMISVSNSHNDFFVRNLVAILAEFRAAFGVIRPQAFCRIDMTSSIAS